MHKKSSSQHESETPSGDCSSTSPRSGIGRRSFLETAGTVAMLGGLAASYGTAGYCALQYLQPDSQGENLGWQFVADVRDLEGVDSVPFTASSGAKIVVARQAVDVSAIGFIALSSVCPHLGCQVFWESAHMRFFCPCHNGAFDQAGKAIAGPPAAAKQSLKQFEVKLDGDLLFVLAPLHSVTDQVGGQS